MRGQHEILDLIQLVIGHEFTCRAMCDCVLYLVDRDAMAQLLATFPAVATEMRGRVSSKLVRWRREAARQAGGVAPESVIDEDYPQAGRSDGSGVNADVARVEAKVDRLAKHMDYLVRSFNAAAQIADS
eukprot:COSAG05_NODE_1444_length_4871_cov_14.212070_7_plen_129_part_00